MGYEHQTLDHVDMITEEIILRNKKSYATELEAQHLCFKLNLLPHSIHKAVSYKCSICGKWHIGHNSRKTLTEDNREKIERKYRKWRIVNNITL